MYCRHCIRIVRLMPGFLGTDLTVNIGHLISDTSYPLRILRDFQEYNTNLFYCHAAITVSSNLWKAVIILCIQVKSLSKNLLYHCSVTQAEEDYVTKIGKILWPFCMFVLYFFRVQWYLVYFSAYSDFNSYNGKKIYIVSYVVFYAIVTNNQSINDSQKSDIF